MVISGTPELLWEMDAVSQDDEWHVAELNLNSTDNLYKVRLIGWYSGTL